MSRFLRSWVLTEAYNFVRAVLENKCPLRQRAIEICAMNSQSNVRKSAWIEFENRTLREFQIEPWTNWNSVRLTMPSKLGDDEAKEFERKLKKLTKCTIPNDHILWTILDILLAPRVTKTLRANILFLPKDHGHWVRISKSQFQLREKLGLRKCRW